MLEEGCCFYVNQLVIIKDKMWQIQTDLQKLKSSMAWASGSLTV